MVLKDVLRAIVVSPLTAGNINPHLNRPDGTISAAVAMLLWLAVMCVLNQGRINPSIQKELTVYGVVYFILSLNVILGFCACLYIAFYVLVRGTDSVAFYCGSGKFRKLRLGFLWFFAVSVVGCSLEKVYKNLFCIFLQDFPNWRSVDFIADTIYNTFLFMFTCADVFLIHYFIAYKFKHLTRVHYSIILIISANLTVWFHTVNLPNIDPADQNNTNTPANNYVCFTNGSSHTGTSHWNQFIEKSRPITRPMILEFAILSTSLVFELWSPYQISKLRENSWFAETESETDADASNADTYGISSLLSSVNVPACIMASKYRVFRCSFFVPLGLGLIITLTLITMCILGFTQYKDDDDYHVVYRVYCCIYDLIIIVSLYYGFYVLKTYMVPVTSRKLFHLKELIMLFSVFAVFQYYVYIILAGSIADTVLTHSVIASGCFGIICEYLQVVFLLQAYKFKPSRNSPRHAMFEGLLILNAVLSLGMWAIEGFVGTKYGFYKDIISTVGHTSWYFIEHTLFPVLIFYRFHVFFAYFSLYQQFNNNHTKSQHKNELIK